ncbi:MAG: patatin-like phospholipase family protein [Gemmatimonadota bacterium]
MSWLVPQRTALVLGGGGLKGFAHIGVMRALEERGIVPSRYAGTSIGALIAAARVAGVPLDEMERRAITVSKRDLFRLNRAGMLLERSRAPSLYLEQPLRDLVDAVVPEGSFRGLANELLVNTVDLERAAIVVWGLPGLEDVSIRNAVYASCALPGFFPPATVGGRVCVDGGTIDNLPTAIASLGVDVVIAVDVGNTDLGRAQDVTSRGFAAIYMRAASVMMHALQLNPLATWMGPPMLLIRPRVGHREWFAFSHAEEMIEAGYEGTLSALDDIEDGPLGRDLIYPRRRIKLSVDRDKCIGCGVCMALAPRLMEMDAEHKAFAVREEHEWSPADGEFVGQCPTSAITVESLATRRQTTRPVEQATVDR